MADEQMTARDQLIGKSREQSILSDFVEIDHHVSTKDDVEVSVDRPLRLNEVNTTKGDQFLNFRTYLKRSLWIF